MTHKGTLSGLAILVAMAALLGYTAWRLRTSEVPVCDVCIRPLHARSRVVGLIEDKRQRFCCPACAFTAHRQIGKLVKLLELTDYENDASLKPEGAYLVVGSSVNHCVRERMLLDRDKQSSPLDFDRCSPSMIAFARREAAEGFAGRNRGAIHRFQDVAAAYHR
ncbi:MAG: hypothetical protein HY820_19000 [Acidobacteria bacterium]|nr:hypothetical protein [Acidobacteriota bacterium]